MNKQIKRMDDIWSKLIKAKAGYKSEISDNDGQLESHHLLNKPNYALRYSLMNGICLTIAEHNFQAHAHVYGRTRYGAYRGRRLNNKFKQKVMELRGEDIFEKLQVIKNDRTKVDLDEVETFLKSELKKYK